MVVCHPFLIRFFLNTSVGNNNTVFDETPKDDSGQAWFKFAQ
jgi:hypothetical protein